jgi:hypothetical protein
MAIKSKGKTKQRPVARGPRHDPVPVPVPFFRRRWVQLVSMFIVGVLALSAVLWAWNGFQGYRADDRAAQALAARQTTLSQWKGILEAQMTAVNAQLQGDVTPVIATDISSAVDALAKGTEPSANASDLSSSADEFGKAAKAIDSFDLAGAISNNGGFDAEGSISLTSSKVELVQALRQYEQAANLAVLAMAASGATRANLATYAKAAEGSASSLLESGWIKYSSILSENQLAASGTPSGLGSGLGGGLPGGAGG